MRIASVFLALLSFSALSQPIDDYSENASISADLNNSPVTTTDVTTTVIGGERTLTGTIVVSAAPVFRMRCTTSSGKFTMSCDNSVIGICSALYAGTNGNGISPVEDISARGGCWNFHFEESDNNMEIRASFRSTLQAPLIDVTYDILTSTANQDICIPFDSSTATALGSVDSIEVSMGGLPLAPSVDAAVAYVCPQPTVSCWHEFALLGSTLTINVKCNNYDSLPATTEDIDVEFPFDSSFGDVVFHFCIGATTSSIVSNALEFSASLGEGDSVECSMFVLITNAGTVNDVGAIVDANNGFPTFRSTEGGDRSGTVAFCDPPMLSSITL